MLFRYAQGLRRMNPTLLRYFVAVALIGFAVDGGIYSVLFNLFLVRLGYGPEAIGAINAVALLVFACISLPSGLLGERFGLRRIMLIGLVVMCFGTLFIPLADLIPEALRMIWLMAGYSVMYIGLAFYFVNAAPFILMLTLPSRRSVVFARQTALMSMFAFVGSLVGGALPPWFATILMSSVDSPIPYRYALLFAGLTILPAVLMIWAIPRDVETTQRANESVNGVMPSQEIVPIKAILGILSMLALVRLLQVSGVAVTTTFLNIYLDTDLLLSTAHIGAIIAAGRLLGVPAALVTSMIAARIGNRRVVMVAAFGSMLSLLPLALIPHWVAATIGFVGVVAFSWMRYASSVVYFMEQVPHSRRATLSGMTEMASGVCFTVLSFGGGYMASMFGYRSLFLLGAVLVMLSGVVFWMFFHDRPGSDELARIARLSEGVKDPT